MNTTIRIVLIEDHPEYRDTIRLVLEREPDLELIETFGTTERAIPFLKDRQQDPPEIVLLDLNLPGLGGLESIPLIQTVLPDIRIIVLTQSNHEADVIRALSLGASGYLLKSSTLDQIVESIRTVIKDGTPLDPGIARYIVATMRTKLVESERENLLSTREMEVLTLLAKGKVKKEIAAELGISTTTVVTHVNHIYEKLDARNAPAAVAKAFGIGILPAPNQK